MIWMRLITDKKELEILTKEYFEWQKKILDIGDELNKRNEPITSRSKKLSEELMEVNIKFNDYFIAKKEYKMDFIEGVKDEIGDINNVAGITLAMINGRDDYFDGTLPLEIMFLRLIGHHPEYRTKPKTIYTIGKEYTKKKKFKAWISEIQHIVDLRETKINENKEKGKKIQKKLNDLTSQNNLNVMKKIEFCSKMDYEMINSEINPLFGLYVGIGDLVNNALILFGFLDKYSYLDLFRHMKNKLYDRDERYDTGKNQNL